MSSELSALYSALIVVIAVVVGVAVYVFIHRFLFRRMIRVLRRPLIIIIDLVVLLFIASMILGIIGSVYGFHEFFAIIFGLFVIGSLAILLGSRHVLEEYLSGVFSTELYDLKIGDYIELDNVRGHVVALEETAIVIRDPHRDLVYIPYTKLLHSSFKRFRAEEGHEIVVHATIPARASLSALKEDILKEASSLGLENIRISIESLGIDSLRIVIRGIIRDVRREEEIKYLLLDYIYTRALQSK